MSGNGRASFGPQSHRLDAVRNRMRSEAVQAAEAEAATRIEQQSTHRAGRRAPLGIVAMVGALGAVAVSCGSPVMETRQQETTPRFQNSVAAGEFSRELQQRYLELATRAYDRADFASSDFYAVRSMMAGEGQLAEPRLIDGRGLSPEALADARMVRQRLANAMQVGVRNSRPVMAAQVQAAFDCWMNEAMRASDPNLRDQCRNEATSSIVALEGGNKDYAYRAPGQGTMANGQTTQISPSEPMMASAAPQSVAMASVARGDLRSTHVDSGIVIGADGVAIARSASHSTISQQARTMVPQQRVIGEGTDYAAMGYTYVGHIGPDGKLVTNKAAGRMTVAAARAEKPVRIAAAKPARHSDTAAIETAATKISPTDLIAAAKPREGDFVVFFPLGSDKVTLEAEDTLIDLVDQIQRKNATRVKLIGHTDRSGNPKLNQLLSMRRAQAVRQYLMRAVGRDLEVEIDAKGENAPALQTSDGLQQALNRRVEIDIL